jgi:NADPH:quinone reductase-like Zn-dependent oxidoreductase
MAELRWLLEQASMERLKPAISARYPLADAVSPLRDIYERRVIGKVIIEP